MVSTASRYVEEIRPYFETEHREMLRILLGSTSPAEANLALAVLREGVPEKSLVTAANLREAIAEIPSCPIWLALDMQTLQRVWEMEWSGNTLSRSFDDDGGSYEIVLPGAGNLCYDIGIRSGGATSLWVPQNAEEDFLSDGALDAVMRHKTILRNVAELVMAMGLPFNPTFYLSLEDWHLEYAGIIFDELGSAFGPLSAGRGVPRDIFDI